MKRYLYASGAAALTAVAMLAPRPACAARLAVGSYYNHMVVRYDTPSGVFLDAMVPPQGGGLRYPLGMALGPDGNLYVANSNTGKVHRYDRDTGEYLGDFTTGMSCAADITFGPDGHLYVVNQCYHRIDRYHGTTGAYLGVFASGNMNSPTGMAFSPDGQYLLVGDQTGDRVMRFSATTGAFVDVFVSANSGGLDHPFDLAFGPNGNLYVSSVNTGRVLSFNGSTGAFVRSFLGVGGYQVPLGIAFDQDGTLYVADWGENKLQKFNSVTGQHLGVILAAGGLDHPYFICFLPPVAPANLAGQVVVNTVVPAPGQAPRKVPGIKLTWSDTGNDEDGYVIERRKGDDAFEPLATVGANILTLTDSSVLPEVAYTYRVKAGNELGWSRHSPTSTATVYPEVSLVLPSGINFLPTLVGQSNTQTVTLRNPTKNKVFATLAVTGGPFAIPAADQTLTLAAGQTKAVPLTYTPPSAATHPGFLQVVVGNAPPKTINIKLKGSGVLPKPPMPASKVKVRLVVPTAVAFTNIYAGQVSTRTLTVRNAGNVAATVQVVGPSTSGPFSVEGEPSFQLAPGATRVLTVNCAPLAVGKPTGSLKLVASAVGYTVPSKTATVKLTATVKAAPAGP
jgi:DNA-binding beta-propeller fold protein YncE